MERDKRISFSVSFEEAEVLYNYLLSAQNDGVEACGSVKHFANKVWRSLDKRKLLKER